MHVYSQVICFGNLGDNIAMQKDKLTMLNIRGFIANANGAQLLLKQDTFLFVCFEFLKRGRVYTESGIAAKHHERAHFASAS